MLRPFSPLLPLLAALLFLAPSAAHAADEDFEAWFNPVFVVDLDEDTYVKLETAQRLRSAGRGREDTYFFRLWAWRKLGDGMRVGGAIERRINDGKRDEIRAMQQVQSALGILRVRMRLEERFAQGAGARMGLRLRSRAGLAIPLDRAENWHLMADAESFITLRNSFPPGDIGKTALRTQVYLAHRVNERLSVRLGYLRHQEIEPAEPDEVGHAPILGFYLTL
ncbi:DUF2490 domain-containing protein [Erythrobacter sp.]|uniref:DUF2490 domain-containing protein n=1 Tax=Erythrobacter sp. TaxID=1042 RepID=UPI001425D239|nr:DUF2490 domain-containing protein [Erythrobacter sp.]QIQ85627.1 MAG: DUF2490 domain-containing protein [Erythrobacter sp.]